MIRGCVDGWCEEGGTIRARRDASQEEEKEWTVEDDAWVFMRSGRASLEMRRRYGPEGRGRFCWRWSPEHVHDAADEVLSGRRRRFWSQCTAAKPSSDEERGSGTSDVDEDRWSRYTFQKGPGGSRSDEKRRSDGEGLAFERGRRTSRGEGARTGGGRARPYGDCRGRTTGWRAEGRQTGEAALYIEFFFSRPSSRQSLVGVCAGSKRRITIPPPPSPPPPPPHPCRTCLCGSRGRSVPGRACDSMQGTYVGTYAARRRDWTTADDGRPRPRMMLREGRRQIA